VNLSELLDKRSASHFDKKFILFERQPHTGIDGIEAVPPFRFSLTYAEFNDVVNQSCHYLASLGLRKGDVFNLHLPNCVAFMILWFAGARLGAVIMPTNVLASAEEMAYLLRHSGSKISFTTQSHFNTIEHCLEKLDGLEQVICCDPYTNDPYPDAFEAQVAGFPDRPFPSSAKPRDLAAIMYTSGTTSKPKGVMVTHANYIKAGQTVADAIELTTDDRQYVVLPLFHGNAQYYSTMSALLTGASIALMDRFSASQYFDKCIEYDCTVASLFAAPMRMILAQPSRVEHLNNVLRVVIYAQNITDQQMENWHERFDAPLSQLWGMTETMGPPLMNPLHGERRNWTVGKPIGGYEVRLVNADGGEVPVGQQGEIAVKGIPGESIMAGYFQNEQATRETIRDNWLYTGDNAVQDDQEYFRFVDRVKDMIKRSGENVSAGEVESVLLQHPAVFECAVIGLPDEMRDEQIVGVVVLHKNNYVTEAGLIAFCAEKLAAFRVPQQIVFETTLPKTSVGKIQKHLVRAKLIDNID
jgi:crotonobetaine/carnitine-CoA ligase